MNQYCIFIGIIYMIPFLIMIGISISRKRLETDRNFYGNEIQPENIELTNVKYNSFEVQRDEIKKITEMGKIKYVYGYFEDEQVILSEKEYLKYFPDSNVKAMIAYYITFEFDYHSNNGEMHAEIDLMKPSFEKMYDAKNVEEIKNIICNECKNKIFAYVGECFKYKDFKGRRVTHYLSIETSEIEGKITGKSNKKPGKYDWMFSDSSWYPEEIQKRNKILAFCSYLNPYKENSIFGTYVTIPFLGMLYFLYSNYHETIATMSVQNTYFIYFSLLILAILIFRFSICVPPPNKSYVSHISVIHKIVSGFGMDAQAINLFIIISLIYLIISYFCGVSIL
ncbi:Uncharacterised protein [Anaerostipes hadrus]|uniref:Uncharacterized protein n=1 Tax=Anaerostipes hadrus TaxID=649756 RepID=A0A174JIE6_ANAHA|nr:hypothetical protein [Anaerostipes hadrus]CUO98391.1 Uncharacterised protein [Anaerostipes hadrus]